MLDHRNSLFLATAIAFTCIIHTADLKALPPLDEVMGLSSGNSIQFNADDPNHESVARLEYLGHTMSEDGDYQYWYDIVSGYRAWTRDVVFWISNADTITNLSENNYTETGAACVLEHWWGVPMASTGLDVWGGHRDFQNSPSHGIGNSWNLTTSHPDPLINQFHEPGDYAAPGFFSGQPSAFYWGPPSRIDDSLTLSDGTQVWKFEKNHYAPLVNNSVLYPFSGLCGTFVIESSNPPADDSFGWSTYHNTTVDSSQSQVSAYGYLPGPGDGTSGKDLVLAIQRTGELLEFSWNGESGKQYDLVSSSTLRTPPTSWEPYDDGETVFANIPDTGTGVNTLRGVHLRGEKRFFAIVEENLGTLLDENFDNAEGLPPGWVASGSGSTAWEIGIPGETLFGPVTANSIPHCAGTNLSGDYTASQDVSLITPAIQIPASGATLTYRQWLDTEGDGDAGAIRILDAGNDNRLLEELVGNIEWNDTAWDNPPPVTLPNSASGKLIRLEFRFVSNDSNPESFAGFYLDDIILQSN